MIMLWIDRISYIILLLPVCLFILKNKKYRFLALYKNYEFWFIDNVRWFKTDSLLFVFKNSFILGMSNAIQYFCFALKKKT